MSDLSTLSRQMKDFSSVLDQIVDGIQNVLSKEKEIKANTFSEIAKETNLEMNEEFEPPQTPLSSTPEMAKREEEEKIETRMGQFSNALEKKITYIMRK